MLRWSGFKKNKNKNTDINTNVPFFFFHVQHTLRPCAEGGKKFIGGLPAESPFKWVDKKKAEAAGIEPVVPGCFTEPTGGGQAVAYIYFDPVTLVKKAGADSSSPNHDDARDRSYSRLYPKHKNKKQKTTKSRLFLAVTQR